MKEFPFGVTFYPEQWPREVWEESFRMIKDAGFNLVRFGEMAWDWVELDDNEFAWEELDDALELADRFGIKVILGLATSQAPVWLLRKHPELRPVSNMGTLYPEYGPRPNVCRDSEQYKKYVKRYITKMVNRYKKHPALFAWQIDNEPVYPPLDSTTHEDFCHCEFTREKFLKWIKQKYGSIERLNKEWGTRFWTNTFSKWEDITTPKCGIWDAGNPHIFIDWYRFKSVSIHEWLLWEKELVYKLDGKHKVGTNGFLEICPRMHDHDLLSEGLDWYGWDVYPKGRKSTPGEVACTADWWRSFGLGRDLEFHVTELQGGPNVRWGHPGYVTGTDIKMWTHQMVAHGAKTLLYHNWRTPVFGGEAGGFGIINPDGTPTERLDAIKEVGEEVKETFSKLQGFKLEPEYAIFYLRDSDVQTFQEQGPPRIISGQWEALREDIGLRHSMRSIEGAHKVLWPTFTPIDMLFQRQLEEDYDLGRYKSILVPNPYIFTEKWWECIRKYVENGGVVITESRFGAKTPMGFLQIVPLMEKCIGLKRLHHEVIDDGKEPYIPSLKCYAYGFKDVINPGKNRILAKFDDGKPAIVEVKIGKGKIIYGCFSLFLSCLKNKNAGIIRLLRKNIPKASVYLECLEGKEIGDVELIPWKKGNIVKGYVVNYTDKVKNVVIRKGTKKFSLRLKPHNYALKEI